MNIHLTRFKKNYQFQYNKIKDLVTQVTFKKFNINKIQNQFNKDIENNSEVFFDKAE